MKGRLFDAERDSLWRLAVSPTIWALHFLISYGAAAIWCAKIAGRTDHFEAVRLFILALTAGALLCIGWMVRIGWQAHRTDGGKTPHDEDTPEDRHRFLGLAVLLLSLLSAVAVIYTALAAVFVGTCR